MPQPTIYVLSPDDNGPCGGVKKLYRHVDVLNRRGLPASIIHQQEGFRCTWFANETKVCYARNTGLTANDYLVLPEIHGPKMADLAPGIKKVVLNQNCYLTFGGYSLDKRELATPYTHPEVVATIINSEDGLSYLRYAFPQHKFLRMRYGIDPESFHPTPTKKKQICLMPRRHFPDALQVINILKFRNALQDFEIVTVHGKTEAETAAILRDSLIFLSFSTIEGFGLPPAEAMACGCVTIGYHGRGGKEFFRPEFSYPIEFGDIEGFARTVEQVIREVNTNPGPLIAKTQQAASFIARNYSPQVEEADIVGCWLEIMGMGPAKAASPAVSVAATT